MSDARRRAVDAARVADRLDALAEIAELMDDDLAATRFRHLAARRRLDAMHLLDE